jgi:hypothetical protein
MGPGCADRGIGMIFIVIPMTRSIAVTAGVAFDSARLNLD